MTKKVGFMLSLSPTMSLSLSLSQSLSLSLSLSHNVCISLPQCLSLPHNVSLSPLSDKEKRKMSFPLTYSRSLRLSLFQVYVLPRPPHQHAGGDRPAFKTPHTGPETTTTTLFLQHPRPPVGPPVPLPGHSFKQQRQGRMNSLTHHHPPPPSPPLSASPQTEISEVPPPPQTQTLFPVRTGGRTTDSPVTPPCVECAGRASPR